MTSDNTTVPPMPSTQRFAPKGLGSVFVVSFIVLFLTTVCARLLALGRRSRTKGTDRNRSIVASVRSSVYNFISYIP